MTENYLFQAELRPNRSSSPLEIRRLNTFLCAILVSAGFIFISAGAWPVFGFFTIEIVLLITLLNFNHRYTYMMERISINTRDVKVERINARGHIQQWCFKRYWLQVNLNEDDKNGYMLELRSHGRAIIIGSFLSHQARLQIAEKLNIALRN